MEQFDATKAGLSHRVLTEGEVDHTAWMRARAEGGFVGTCRQCGDYLVPARPYEHAGRTDYQADCRNDECRSSLLAPGGRVMRSALKSMRGA